MRDDTVIAKLEDTKPDISAGGASDINGADGAGGGNGTVTQVKREPTESANDLETLHLRGGPKLEAKEEDDRVVEKKDLLRGFRFGNSIIPFTKEQYEDLKYKSEGKCFQLMSFVRDSDVCFSLYESFHFCSLDHPPLLHGRQHAHSVA